MVGAVGRKMDRDQDRWGLIRHGLDIGFILSVSLKSSNLDYDLINFNMASVQI